MRNAAKIAPLALVASLALAACGGGDGQDTEPSQAPVTTKALGRYGVTECVPQSTNPAPPLKIVGGQGDVYDGSTRITLKLSTPFTKNTFSGGVGDAATLDYGFRVKSLDNGRYISRSYKTSVVTLFNEDGTRAEKPPVVQSVADGKTLTLTFPTEPLDLRAGAWEATVYVTTRRGPIEQKCVSNQGGPLNSFKEESTEAPTTPEATPATATTATEEETS